MQEFKGKHLVLEEWPWSFQMKKMTDLMKNVQSLEGYKISLKVVTKTIKNKTKGQKGAVLGMFLGTLGASLSGNRLAGKGIVRLGYGNKMDF